MSWKVKFIDYPQQFSKMEPEIMATISRVLSNGDLMLRQHLIDFEEHLAAFVGTRYAVGTNNCTDALHLSLRAAGIGSGDEVITVSHTFVATVAAIHHSGARPILIDVGEDHNMDPELVEEAITPRTKAILPVHLNGRLCQMDSLMTIAKRHNLIIIEDSAQALGGTYRAQCGGSFGLAGCFSFYPAKMLGAFGDGGAVTTNDEHFADKIRLLRNHGRDAKGEISGWSFNSRMDNLQAALLDLKLKNLTKWIEKRREVANSYSRLLADIKQMTLPPPPRDEGKYYDVFQNYEIEAENRDELVRYLKQNGVEILIPWGGKAVHQHEALQLNYFHLPRTEAIFKRVLMLPMTTELGQDQIKYVSDVIHRFYETKTKLSTLPS